MLIVNFPVALLPPQIEHQSKMEHNMTTKIRLIRIYNTKLTTPVPNPIR